MKLSINLSININILYSYVLYIFLKMWIVLKTKAILNISTNFIINNILNLFTNFILSYT